MNNWCIFCFSRIFLLGILIFKGLTARRLYKSFGVKGLKPVKVGLIGPLYEMALAVGRSVIAGDGSVGSAADPGSAGASAAAAAAAAVLSLRLAQPFPLPQPLRHLHRVRIFDGIGLHPFVLPQSDEREECYVSVVLVSLLVK
jgi:hypothetical protein